MAGLGLAYFSPGSGAFEALLSGGISLGSPAWFFDGRRWGQFSDGIRNICVEQSDLNQRAAELIEEAAQIRAETKIKIRDIRMQLERRNVSLDELNRVVRRCFRP